MNTREDIRHEAWRRMTPDAKYALFRSLMDTLWALKEQGIRRQHPGIAGDEIRRKLAALIRDARP